MKKNPISNVTLVEKPNSTLQLSASLDPLVLDSMHEKEFALVKIFDLGEKFRGYSVRIYRVQK